MKKTSDCTLGGPRAARTIAGLVAIAALAACGGSDDVAAPLAPAITGQPAPQTATVGGSATFSVTVDGSVPVFYQWQINGTGLPLGNSTAFAVGACAGAASGVGTATLVLTNLSAGCNGVQVRAQVSNAGGVATSTAVALSIGGGLDAAAVAGTPGSAGSTDGAGAAARFNTANYVARDVASGTLYVGDFNNHTIRAVTPAGVVSTLAGSAGLPGFVDGTGAAARFRGNGGLGVDSAGNVFVADWDNHAVRRIAPGGQVTTLAGNGTAGNANGTGPAARLTNPNGLAVDGSGNVFVADWGNHTVRRITPAGEVTTLAGTAGAAGSADGTGAAARFSQPAGIAVDGSGNVYVADQGNHTIRRITPAGVVSTIAGQAGSAGAVDGTGTAARLSSPAWLSASPTGDLFVVSAAGDTVRKVTPAGVVTTVVGVAGYSGPVVTGGDPRLRNARGLLAISSNELVVIADNAMLRITLP